MRKSTHTRVAASHCKGARSEETRPKVARNALKHAPTVLYGENRFLSDLAPQITGTIALPPGRGEFDGAFNPFRHHESQRQAKQNTTPSEENVHGKIEPEA